MAGIPLGAAWRGILPGVGREAGILPGVGRETGIPPGVLQGVSHGVYRVFYTFYTFRRFIGAQRPLFPLILTVIPAQNFV